MKLAYLRPLYERPGPFASVYLATERHTADAAKALSLRWRHARIELGRLGADEATLDAIEEIVTDRDNAAPGRAVFATAGRVVHSEVLPEPPPQVTVRMSELPDVMPLLESREEPVPHVCVKADRQGADIISVGDRQRQVTTVEGLDWPIRKVRAGGWSESHYQRNAEETWEANAREVAARVAKEADAVDAEVILVGGDVRARELVLDSLGEPYVRRAVPAEHGNRNAGANDEVFEEEVHSVLRERGDEHRDAVVARFREAYGRGDAVGGLADVAEALRGGQVETLLVNRPLRGELWYGPRPYELATSKKTLRALGVDEPHCEAAGSVLARAAAATDAEIVFTEDVHPPQHVGAVLRYTAP
ncbi:MAG TPA: Vms1/Ankzf1 family peptidyl-tRNA hydrolase [Thermomonospora sp.]|nr:Vms1/Ankzf1 family peptidyl-tRNA hydrolase [Thermomonospora sp.]